MRNSLILFALCSILVGCGAHLDYDQPITATNYKKSISINKLDRVYYGAKYEGKDSGCAQNDGFESCSERFLTITRKATGRWGRSYNKDLNAVFSKGDPFEAEAFRAGITKSARSGDGGITSNKRKEFLFLTLADLSLQRNFKYLVLLETVGMWVCWDSPSADTLGTLSPDGMIYTGTTIISPNSSCIGGSDLIVLMLNDPEQLANGIVYTEAYDGDRRLFLEDRLYVGAPGFSPPAYTGMTKQVDMDLLSIVPHKAWKKVYDASGLSRDLRLKYGVTGAKPYTFTDDRLWNIKRKADNVIDKNIVK